MINLSKHGMTERQIFDCLTKDVTSHDLLKQALCNKYPSKKNLIIKVFNNYNF